MKWQFRRVAVLFFGLILFLCACAPPQADIETNPPPATEKDFSASKPPDDNQLPPKAAVVSMGDDGHLRYSSRIPEEADIYPDGEGPVVLTLKEGTLRPTKAVFFVRNTGTMDIGLWRYQPELQILIDGEWETPPSYGGGGGYDAYNGLKAGEEKELIIDWTNRYGQLYPGTYRFIQDFDCSPEETYYASCTFVIEAQDRSDEKFQGYPWPIGLEDEGIMPDDIPVSLLLVPETLTPGSADFVYKNETSVETRVDLSYFIQIKIEDHWYIIEWRKVEGKISEPPTEEGLKPISPMSSVVISFNWEHAYGKLPAGTYRIMRRVRTGDEMALHDPAYRDNSFDLYSEPFTIE